MIDANILHVTPAAQVPLNQARLKITLRQLMLAQTTDNHLSPT